MVGIYERFLINSGNIVACLKISNFGTFEIPEFPNEIFGYGSQCMYYRATGLHQGCGGRIQMGQFAPSTHDV